MTYFSQRNDKILSFTNLECEFSGYRAVVAQNKKSCCKNISKAFTRLKPMLVSIISKEIKHSENSVFSISKMRLDLECSDPASNSHASYKNAKQLKEKQNTHSILRHSFRVHVTTGLQHSGSDLISELSRLRNNLIFEMLYCSQYQNLFIKPNE